MTVAPAAAVGQRALAKAAVERASRSLLDRQDERGWWRIERPAQVADDAEDLLFRHFADIGTPELTNAAARWIRSVQGTDGSWCGRERGAGDLSSSVLAYLALRLAGDSPDAYHMAMAAGWIRDAGGLAPVGIRARVWLALLGLAEWEELPVPPPEAIYLPVSCPVRLPGQPGWGRATVMPLAVIAALRPVRELPFGLGELRVPAARGQQLAPASRPEPATRLAAASQTARQSRAVRSGRTGQPGEANGIAGLDRSLPAFSRTLRLTALGAARTAALRKCGEWIIAARRRDGSWPGSRTGWLFSLLALQLLGHRADDPVLAGGLAALDGSVIWMPRADAPVRRLDTTRVSIAATALAVSALTDAGLPRDHAALSAAASRLAEEQGSLRAEWRAGSRDVEPAEGEAGPTSDVQAGIGETSAVMLALRRASLPGASVRLPATVLAVHWLASMQRKDGGWGRNAGGPGSALVTRLPLLDLGEARDASSAELTADAVLALAQAGQPGSRAIRRGVTWLLRAQLADGSWPGERGTSDLLATCAVMSALVAAGVVPAKPPLSRARLWLLARQNADGGWGEGYSAGDGRQAGQGSSTPLATARALIALIAVLTVGGLDAAGPLDRGAGFLVFAQLPDGSWQEPSQVSDRSATICAIQTHAAALSALGQYLSAGLGATAGQG